MANLEELLFRGESDALDFKREQYPFEGCPDATKAELLKDILAMANSWRSETAYILIGVDDSFSPPRVVGVTSHLEDASLQQFVNSKTQQPLTFLYRAVELSGQSVGVIEVPVQPRPIFLRKDYGGLKQDVVYLRRGSSTTEAKPDEIARMGAATAHLGRGDLDVQFAVPGKRALLGKELKLKSSVCHVNEEADIPDFDGPDDSPSETGILRIVRRPNSDFYRELVARAKDVSLFRLAGLTVANRGNTAAKKIRVELALADPERTWEFRERDPAELPMPVRHSDSFTGALERVPFLRSRDETGLNIEHLDGTWHLAFDFGDLQPSRIL